MAVYFALVSEVGRVKIGFSDQPRIRLSKLKCDGPFPPTFVRLLDGGEAEEAALHVRFAAHRLHGDWFTFSEDMMGDLGLPDYVFPDAAPPATALEAYLDNNEIRVIDFAEKVGVTTAALYRYLVGERVPRMDIMARIAKATNGAVMPNDFFSFAPPTVPA